MLHSNVDPLFNVSVTDNLVDDYTNGVRGDVVDDTSTSRIEN